jgi:hypothetical protein
MNKADKQLLKALALQLISLALTGSAKTKASRYLAAADACDQVSDRLRERATEADQPAAAVKKTPKR